MENIYQYFNNFKKIINTEIELLYGKLDIIDEPLISIIITVYKRKEYLYEAIDSAINQYNIDFNYEIIVICDDPDGEFEQIQNYKDKKNFYFYRNKKNIGLYNCCNLGAQLAKGKYIAFLHDDDLLYPDFLFEIHKFITHNVKCILVNRDVIGINNSKQNINILKITKVLFLLFYFIRLFFRKPYKKITLKEGLIYQLSNVYKAPSCGTLFEKEIFLKTGGFNHNYWPVSDYYFFLSFNKNYDIYMIRKKLACYRWLDNLSQNKSIQFLNIELLSDFFKSKQPIKEITNYFNFFYPELLYAKFLMVNENYRNEIIHKYPELNKHNKIRWLVFKSYNIIFRFFHDII